MLKQLSYLAKYCLSTLTITGIMFVLGATQRRSTAEEGRWTYTEFVQAVENNDVKQVTIEYKGAKAKAINSENQSVEVMLLRGDHSIEFLIDNNVLFSFVPSLDSNLDLPDLVSKLTIDSVNSLGEITFTRFIQAVKTQKIESIYINKDGFKARVKFINGSDSKVYLPLNSSYLYEILVENNVAIASESYRRNNHTKNQWTYSQLLQEIEDNTIKQVIIDHQVTQAKITTFDNQRIIVKIPRNVNYTLNFLIDKDIIILFKSPQENYASDTTNIITESLQQYLNNTPEIAFSEFIHIVKDKQVKFFILQKNKYESIIKLFDGSEFKVIMPFDPNYTIDILADNNVLIGIEN